MPQRPWDTTKQTSVCVRGVPEGEERNGQKEIFKEKNGQKFSTFEEKQSYTSKKYNE